MAEQKSKLRLCVEEMNVKRIICSGMIVASVFLLMWIYITITGICGSKYGYASLIMGLCACLQLLFAGIAMNLKDSDSTDYYWILAVIYYGITYSMIFVDALICMRVLNSVVIYALLIMYAVFVPVCMKRMRNVLSVWVAVSSAIALFVDAWSNTHILDIVVLTVAGELLISYHHRIEIDNLKMSLKLKSRTQSSQHDALTGLMNRRGMQTRLSKIWKNCVASGKSIAFIEMDIDFFKKYNDEFGHPKGDECLKTVAAAIKSAVGNKGFVTRSGGEEFIVVLKDFSKKDVVSVAMKIRSAIAKKEIKHAYCAVANIVTVSMGIAYCIPTKEDSIDIIYENADKALYKAKECGRNCVVFEGNLYGRIKNGMAQVISL